MKNIAIQDFMDKHDACDAGRRWVKKQGCATSKETFEALCDGKAGEHSLDWAMWFASRPGVLSKREVVGFAAWCARRVAHLLTDERSVNALELVERYAAGEDISSDELKEAADAASDACAAAWAYCASRASQASRAALAARAARAAAWAADACAADYASDASAGPTAERRAQLERLREIVKFEDGE